MKHTDHTDFGGYLNIIPLTIDQFIDVFKFCKALPDFKRHIIRDLFDRIIALKDKTNNSTEWQNQIFNAINDWKQLWQSSVNLLNN
jgi:hypothetical protein